MNLVIPLSWICVVGSPFVGSFLGTLVLRLPANRSVLFGRSFCDACGHVLGLRDLVPLISWAWNSRTCAYCGARVSVFYPLIEIAALGIALWAFLTIDGWLLIASCVFGWTLLVLGLIDWRAQRLPDVATIPLLLCGLAASRFIDADRWLDHWIGAAAAFIALWGVARLYRMVRGREGLGLGDAKLMAAVGAWVGWQNVPSVILIGAVLGLIFVGYRSLRGLKVSGDDRIPLGPFLALAAWIVWLYGPLVPR